MMDEQHCPLVISRAPGSIRIMVVDTTSARAPVPVGFIPLLLRVCQLLLSGLQLLHHALVHTDKPLLQCLGVLQLLLQCLGVLQLLLALLLHTDGAADGPIRCGWPLMIPSNSSRHLLMDTPGTSDRQCTQR